MPRPSKKYNQEDRDLLIELRTQMSGVRDDIKDLKDGFSSRLSNLEQNMVSKIVVEDHETRLRFIERYVWGALAVVAVLMFLLNYFQPFIN
jgi:hypothetical protein